VAEAWRMPTPCAPRRAGLRPGRTSAGRCPPSSAPGARLKRPRS
jgi:hypothetical protein